MSLYVHTVDKKDINIVHYLGLSHKSAEVIIMCAFGAHMIKEVTRSQMTSALKFFSGPRHLQKSDKSQLTMPLAMTFLDKKIVAIKDDADPENLSRNDVTKSGTF